MLYEKVKQIIETETEGKRPFIVGVEPIINYVCFYFISIHLQNHKYNKSTSIYKYSNNMFEKQNQGIQLLEAEYERFKFNEYENTLDFFNRINYEKKLELLERQVQESKQRKYKLNRGMNLKGNSARYQGNKLMEYQIYEFKGMLKTKSSQNLTKTYKRLVSDKFYLSKITFKEYKMFIETEKERIRKSSLEHKNIQFYKLEKRLGFELTKCISRGIKRLRNCKNVNLKAAISDLLALNLIPLIDVRCNYVDLYTASEDLYMWKKEITSLDMLIKQAINYIFIYLDVSDPNSISEEDWKRFEMIYRDGSYENNYLIRKDFNSEDFTLYMEVLNDFNREQFQKAKNAIQNNELEKENH
ncbi:hypothetical protein [Bacillus sp. Au-Bac7]|uniref:hypothetical protein n=1 Tax=Bacillus sp. Au-Bac7 TaxID=2906458 RepID=UPI001E3CCC24|nr:hypothetical protein [Bacillus sp. Au-Bac7]MCE4049914.1 hypothetical protein [Bacillus sp. Au-Bac7]